MDPDANFSAILEEIVQGEWEAAADHAESLQSWMRNGGFPPGGGKLRKTSIDALLGWLINHPERNPDNR
jgi:hypothetical protein